MRLYGVDGCRSGWVVASSRSDLASLSFEIVPSFADLLKILPSHRALAVIDIPIGLADVGARACDAAARARLRAPRASSVFPAPCQATLQAATYKHACALNFAASGRKITRECFNILPKIRQVDDLMTPLLQERVREGHPEVIFAELRGLPYGLAPSKRSPAGEVERLILLSARLPGFDQSTVLAERRRLGASRVTRDDLIDAAACLLAAGRLARGVALVLPAGEVPRNNRGLRLEIVA